MGEEGQSAKGIFYHSAGQGRAFRRGKRSGGALQRFAEALSYHVTQEDVDSGRLPADTVVDPGGNPRRAAVQAGVKAASGNGMLQRIRQRLGRQAV